MGRRLRWLWRRAVWGGKVVLIVGMGALAPGAPPPELPRPQTESKQEDGDDEDD